MNINEQESFILGWDLSRLEDEDSFAYMMDFPECEKTAGLILTAPLVVPKPVLYMGNLKKLRDLDFPYNIGHWPLMSRSMLSILKGVGELNVRQIPVLILDDTVSSSELFLKSGKPDPNHAMDKFVAIQLLEHLDVFDWERSEYKTASYAPEFVSFIDRLVLKTISGGYPPIFRMSAYPALLMVSGEAKNSLEGAGVAGTEFRTVGRNPV